MSRHTKINQEGKGRDEGWMIRIIMEGITWVVWYIALDLVFMMTILTYIYSGTMERDDHIYCNHYLLCVSLGI